MKETTLALYTFVCACLSHLRRNFLWRTPDEAIEQGLTHYAWHGLIPVYISWTTDGPRVATRCGLTYWLMPVVDLFQLSWQYITLQTLGYVFFVTGRLDGNDDDDSDDGELSHPQPNQGSFNFNGAPHAA